MESVDVLVLEDAEGIMRPLAFITPLNDAGQLRADKYKLEKGDKIVVARLTKVSDYN